LVEIEEEFADRTEVRSAKHGDGVLGASHRATRRRPVPQPHAAVLVLADPTLVIPEQGEPADRDVPWALVDERGGVRVTTPMARELPTSASGSFFGTTESHSSIGSEPRNASIASRTRRRSR
jgi:hypothetical protein